VPLDPLAVGEPLVTPEDVQNVTGQVVTADQILLAQAVVEIHAGAAIGDATVIEQMRSDDLRLIRMTVAYQAPWMRDQIDYTARTDVSQVEGDARARPRDEHALFLAPLASRALSRVTWKRQPTARNRTRVRARAPLRVPPDVCVSHSVMDNPGQQYGFMTDSGEFWGAP
jgi:hypothetical protein